ncbi:hypothetical protein AB0P45_26380, partial [Streptomyces niveus]|uniref:hypothetical protein n=1 Tax=Streptomyces niveus TaxID=193462 RepID=UPI0034367D9C
RQRAALYGGTVTIGPSEDRPGWTVDVQLDAAGGYWLLMRGLPKEEVDVGFDRGPGPDARTEPGTEQEPGTGPVAEAAKSPAP